MIKNALRPLPLAYVQTFLLPILASCLCTLFLISTDLLVKSFPTAQESYISFPQATSPSLAVSVLFLNLPEGRISFSHFPSGSGLRGAFVSTAAVCSWLGPTYHTNSSANHTQVLSTSASSPQGIPSAVHACPRARVRACVPRHATSCHVPPACRVPACPPCARRVSACPPRARRVLEVKGKVLVQQS